MTSDLYTPFRGLVRSVLHLQHKFTYCKRQLNTVETWKQGYEAARFVARCSFLHYRDGLDEVRMKRQCKSIRYTLAANFASRWVLAEG